MKERICQGVYALILGILLPGFVFSILPMKQGRPLETLPVESEQIPSGSDSSKPDQWLQNPDSSIQIRVETPDGVENMQLDTYLVGVLLAEMPANFHLEAKKAQAVAARTMTLRLKQRGGKHDRADVCTESGCCQAYISTEDYLNKGKKRESVEIARSVVEQTGGEVVTYRGKLIEATYFSCSGGRTEDAVAVWGSNVAYLQAVDSPGEEMATHHTDTVTFTAEEFADRLGADLYGAPADWFQETTYTDGGGVKTMEICGTAYSGIQLRKLLGLRSTAFSVSVTKSSITIRTSGYGHRVGMSQYGAQAMALRGSTYEQILRHYYSGTEVSHNAP